MLHAEVNVPLEIAFVGEDSRRDRSDDGRGRGLQRARAAS